MYKKRHIRWNWHWNWMMRRGRIMGVSWLAEGTLIMSGVMPRCYPACTNYTTLWVFTRDFRLITRWTLISHKCWFYWVVIHSDLLMEQKGRPKVSRVRARPVSSMYRNTHFVKIFSPFAVFIAKIHTFHVNDHTWDMRLVKYPSISSLVGCSLINSQLSLIGERIAALHNGHWNLKNWESIYFYFLLPQDPEMHIIFRRSFG